MYSLRRLRVINFVRSKSSYVLKFIFIYQFFLDSQICNYSKIYSSLYDTLRLFTQMDLLLYVWIVLVLQDQSYIKENLKDL